MSTTQLIAESTFDGPELDLHREVAEFGDLSSSRNGKKRSIEAASEPTVVDLMELTQHDREVAIAKLGNQFAAAWRAEIAEDNWFDPNCGDLTCEDSVCVVNVPAAGTVKLLVVDESGDFHLSCSPRFSQSSGALESVAVYMYGKFENETRIVVVPVDATDSASSGQMKFVKIKTGKGGWATYEVPADCAGDE